MIKINPESARTKTAIRFFTYGVMTISTIVISALSLLFASGYRFNNESLTFEQGGLAQFVSSPTNATVIIDGKRQALRTPSKANLVPGEHEVTMRLNGYREWSKTISIEPGEIHWLNYTRFIPNNITTSGLREFDTLNASLTSPNRRYVVFQPSAAQPNLVIANIQDELDVTFDEVVLPPNSYTQLQNKLHTFELVEWNLDGRYLLIRHKVANVDELIRFDRQNPDQAINLTQKFGPISKAQFAGNNGNVVFALVGKELRRIPVTATETELLAKDVTSFTVYRGDTIGFVADRNDQYEVGIIKDDRETVVTDYPKSSPPTIALSNYFNRDYLAVATGKKIDIIRDPADAQTAVNKVFTSFEVDQPKAEWLYFSNNGRFIVAQNQSTFTTYDLELAKASQRTFDTKQKVTRPFKWLDDYYLWLDLDNNLRIVEFDGANERAITSVAKGYSVSLSDNADVLFSVGRNSANNKLVFQRSNLTIEE